MKIFFKKSDVWITSTVSTLQNVNYGRPDCWTLFTKTHFSNMISQLSFPKGSNKRGDGSFSSKLFSSTFLLFLHWSDMLWESIATTYYIKSTNTKGRLPIVSQIYIWCLSDIMCYVLPTVGSHVHVHIEKVAISL